MTLSVSAIYPRHDICRLPSLVTLLGNAMPSIRWSAAVPALTSPDPNLELGSPLRAILEYTSQVSTSVSYD